MIENRAEASLTRSPTGLQIATRESRLAMWQAEHVRDLLARRLGLHVGLLGMTTRGDQILDRALSKVGGKGLFVKELEVALEEDMLLDEQGKASWILRRQSEYHVIR